jgi:hypothetical protein
MVVQRSAAETPVRTPCWGAASIATVNAVPKTVVFCGAWGVS